MTRKDEVRESIRYLNHLIDEATDLGLSQEQITNVNLAGITHQLTQISLSLAIIADKLESELKNE